MKNVNPASSNPFSSRIRADGAPSAPAVRFPTVLYDVQDDPTQERPIQDATVEARMIDCMIRLMRACDAPAEQYARLGLELAPAARNVGRLSPSPSGRGQG